MVTANHEDMQFLLGRFPEGSNENMEVGVAAFTAR